MFFGIRDGKVTSVKVFAKDYEEPPVIEVIKKANIFDFGSGTFKDSTMHYFLAKTKDGRNSLQFEVSESKVKFHSAIFLRQEEP